MPPADTKPPSKANAWDEQWQLLPLWCAESYAKLTHPARSCYCKHPARCNYGPLQKCAISLRECPVAGCPVVLSPTDVNLDVELQAAIEALMSTEGAVRPPPMACWLRGGYPSLKAETFTFTTLWPTHELTFKKHVKVEEGEEDGVMKEAAGMRLHLSEQSATGYLGVYRSSNGLFRAEFMNNGKHTFLGRFDQVVEAAVAYAKYAREFRSRQHVEQLDVAVRDKEYGERAAETSEVGSGASKRRRMSSSPRATSLDERYNRDDDDKEAVAVEVDRRSDAVAEAAGVQLHLSKHNSTGYKGVYMSGGRFEARQRVGGDYTSLGHFGTAVEAAIAYAIHVQQFGLAPVSRGGAQGATEGEGDGKEEDEEEEDDDDDESTVEEEAEGMRLYLSERTATGYCGVFPDKRRFRAVHQINGKKTSLGTFATAVQGAVAYAKHVQKHDLEAADECEMRDEDGLYLSKNSASGYRGVSAYGERFEARHRHSTHGESGPVFLGTFDTAVEAAVAYAEHVQLLGQDKKIAKHASVSEAEDGEEAGEDEAGGGVAGAGSIRLHIAESSATGYRGVFQNGTRFQAKFRFDGKDTYIGSFGTAVEAAVAYAKHALEHECSFGEQVGGGECVAEAQGLRLHLAKGRHRNGSKSRKYTSGYVGVRTSTSGSGRYEARFKRKGKQTHLGTFGTAVEAAVAYAAHVQSLDHGDEGVTEADVGDDAEELESGD